MSKYYINLGVPVTMFINNIYVKFPMQFELIMVGTIYINVIFKLSNATID